MNEQFASRQRFAAGRIEPEVVHARTQPRNIEVEKVPIKGLPPDFRTAGIEQPQQAGARVGRFEGERCGGGRRIGVDVQVEAGLETHVGHAEELLADRVFGCVGDDRQVEVEVNRGIVLNYRTIRQTGFRMDGEVEEPV